MALAYQSPELTYLGHPEWNIPRHRLSNRCSDSGRRRENRLHRLLPVCPVSRANSDDAGGGVERNRPVQSGSCRLEKLQSRTLDTEHLRYATRHFSTTETARPRQFLVRLVSSVIPRLLECGVGKLLLARLLIELAQLEVNRSVIIACDADL